jgi:hypothetical protein
MRDLIVTMQVRVPDDEPDDRVLGTLDNAVDTEHVSIPEGWQVIGHVVIVPERLSDQDWNRAVNRHRDAHGDIPVRLCRQPECRDAYRAYTWGAALDCCKVWRAARW